MGVTLAENTCKTRCLSTNFTWWEAILIDIPSAIQTLVRFQKWINACLEYIIIKMTRLPLIVILYTRIYTHIYLQLISTHSEIKAFWTCCQQVRKQSTRKLGNYIVKLVQVQGKLKKYPIYTSNYFFSNSVSITITVYISAAIAVC